MSLILYQDPIDRLHQEQLAIERANRFRKPVSKSQRDYSDLARRAERNFAAQLSEFDLRHAPTTPNAPFDMWVEGVRVEIKAARWHPIPKRGGRYQANIRNHDADILVFDCINGTDHFHIIPMAQVAPRSAIAVWSYDPAQSRGQWVGFLEAWTHLLAAVEQAEQSWQPPLF